MNAMQPAARQPSVAPLAGALPAELARVTKRFGETVALSDVSLRIRPGELVALLGANGAGKTTAVKLLLGLARPTAGSASVFGGDPTLARNRMRTGAMLQVGKVPETLRVREHIEIFEGYYPDPMPLADVAEAAGLRGLEARLFGELSGGQKQRLLFSAELDRVQLPPSHEAILALAMREGVTNVVRHSGASHCAIRLDRQESQVRLTISDDGRGGADSNGFGLTGMLERIAALGGTVVRDGTRGTTLTITLPAIASAGDPALVRSA